MAKKAKQATAPDEPIVKDLLESVVATTEAKQEEAPKPPPVKFADLPLISKMKSGDMKIAKSLLEKADAIRSQMAELKGEYEFILAELSELAEDNGSGFRYGDLAYTNVPTAGRSSFNKKRLMTKYGISADIIKDCTDIGKPGRQRKFVNLSKPDKDDNYE